MKPLGNGLARPVLGAALLLSAMLNDTWAQTVERNARGEPGKDIRVGVYINVKADCSSGPLPTIRLVDKPVNGNVTVKSGKVNAKNYKQCLALEVPAYIAFYKSNPGFGGTDTFTLEVRYPDGRTEVQKLNVTVGASPQGQKA